MAMLVKAVCGGFQFVVQAVAALRVQRELVRFDGVRWCHRPACAFAASSASFRRALGRKQPPSWASSVLMWWWMADLKALPVGQLADKRGCLLWLWGTWPMLPQAIESGLAWGFRYVTGFPWVKRTVNDKLAFGPGYVVRVSTEHVTLWAIGDPPYGPAWANLLRHDGTPWKSVITSPRRSCRRTRTFPSAVTP
ncbi:hypothetical protein D3877_07220 [Azospirillum cavernae]|uniref:Uncharacterized protein n=1 Tax=Azospirillum cavernae TaxID=2320860 RepID=A0A418W2U3_9PROT|nr:hypothetical protein D3877_07220 [Azospirillum cavernae]